MDSPSTTAPDALLGRKIAGRYLITSKLGQGGMGAVFLARQENLQRQVVIKVLLKEATDDDVATQRFEKEALAVSRLAHANIVTIFDFGDTGFGEKFIAMEFLEGRSLRQLIAQEAPLAPSRTVKILLHISRALAAAHQQGIIHRDLKPDNLMAISAPGDADFVKVLDFGIAKLIQKEGEEKMPTLTAAQMLVGTPQYMSPEQIEGRTNEPRIDLYALGVIAFEMLTGKRPFHADSPMKVLVKHLQSPPPAMREVHPGLHCSEELENLVMMLLAKNPDNRPADAETLMGMLETLPEVRGAGVSSSGVFASSPMVQAAAAQRIPTRLPTDMAAALPTRLPNAPVPPGNDATLVQPQTMLGGVDVSMSFNAPRAEPRAQALPQAAPLTTNIVPPPLALGPSPTMVAPVSQADVAATKKSSMVPVIAGLAIVAVAGVGFVMTRGEKPAPVVEKPAPVVAAPPAPVVEKPAPAVAAPPAPVPVKVLLTSTPAGAEVVEADKVLGVTPLELGLTKSGDAHHYAFRLAGHHEETRDVVADADRSVDVVLKAEPAPEPVKPATASKAAPAKKDKAARATKKTRGADDQFGRVGDIKDLPED